MATKVNKRRLHHACWGKKWTLAKRPHTYFHSAHTLWTNHTHSRHEYIDKNTINHHKVKVMKLGSHSYHPWNLKGSFKKGRHSPPYKWILGTRGLPTHEKCFARACAMLGSLPCGVHSMPTWSSILVNHAHTQQGLTHTSTNIEDILKLRLPM